MFKHYIKIALRNLRKYALQNTVSILGLALGFVALSLSAYWYRFESTFDKFHNDWERLYMVKGGSRINVPNKYIAFPIQTETISLLSEMPETESIVTCYTFNSILTINREFFNTIGFEIIQGDTSFLEKPGYCAISETFAIKKFGKKNPIGENLMLLNDEDELKGYIKRVNNNENSGCYVGAVYRGEKHSYLNYDVLMKTPQSFLGYFNWSNMTFVKLRPGVTPEEFEEKVTSSKRESSFETPLIELSNISKLRSLYYTGTMNIKQLRVFALISILLMICAVVNCITLFVSKINGRRKEMGLRLSNGSSRSGLLSLLSIEMIVQFLIALIFAVIFVFVIKDKFSEYTLIGGNTIYIVWSCLLIMALALILSVSVGIITLIFVLKGSLSSTMSSNLSLNKIIRRSGLSIQLFISITCLFCSLSMFHQLSFMKNENWGFKIKDMVSIEVLFENNQETHYTISERHAISQEVSYKMCDRINEMPGVIEANPSDQNFISFSRPECSICVSRNMDDSLRVLVNNLGIFDLKNDLYGLSVIEGALPEKGLATDEIVISECVCRALGLVDPIGKKLYKKNRLTQNIDSYNIVAVVSDIYIEGPYVNPNPVAFFPNNNNNNYYNKDRDEDYYVLVRYKNDIRKELSELTDSMSANSQSLCRITYMDDWFAKFLKPTNDLFKIFSIIAIVCMLIAVSGVYSIITLTCRERRREIAVRKVHGAKVRDILSIFAREYGKILLITSAFAFGVGYVVMHQWVQQFQKQAPISWWIYAVIIVGMALLICLTVIERVLSTARENPADVIKSE